MICLLSVSVKWRIDRNHWATRTQGWRPEEGIYAHQRVSMWCWGRDCCSRHCLFLSMERSQSGGFLMLAQSNEEMAVQSECLQASECLPNSRNPVRELLCGHGIMGAERRLPFQIHLGQHELASQREPSSNCSTYSHSTFLVRSSRQELWRLLSQNQHLHGMGAAAREPHMKM